MGCAVHDIIWKKSVVLWGCADWSQHCLQDIYKLLNNIWKVHISIVCLGFFAPIREFFSHFETPPLPVKDCNFFLSTLSTSTAISIIGYFGFSFYWRIFTHMETSPLQVKGFKFWSMLGTYDHWAVRVL